jgi:hypothetical protein
MLMSQSFFSTLGLELTWLYPRKSQESNWVYGFASLLEALFKEDRLPFGAVHNDGDALEISTPAFSDMEQVERYYKRLMTYIEKMNTVSRVLTGEVRDLTYTRTDTVSGGGHIHVGIPKRISQDPVWLLGFLGNLFRDVQNRPYLNWIFNDCGNIQSAENFVYMKNKLGDCYFDGLREVYGVKDGWKRSPFLKLVLLNQRPNFNVDWKVSDIYEVFDISKGYAVKISTPSGLKPHTIEFRFFDAKKNWDEIRLHIEFVNAYLKYIEKKTKAGKMIRNRVSTVEDIQALAQNDQGLNQFKSFMEEIGLDYGSYHPFVETNYRKRAEAGLLR